MSYTQVCVWPGCVVVTDQDKSQSQIENFVQLMLSELGVRVTYLEEVKTNPDTDSRGYKIEGTGNRNDLVFSVHDEDVMKFAVPRLQYGIRWIEDVMSEINHSSHLYPSRLRDYCSWKA
jgi:hypothetical protein